MYVYLDLNIFDRLEKINSLELSERKDYQLLLDFIEQGNIKIPYSNAHLNDLFRGFQKNPNYIDSHLNSIESLTNNLCVCQYWNNSNVTWHTRSIKEFFEQKKEDWEFETGSFSELFEDDAMMQSVINLYKMLPLDSSFKQGYKDPLFGVMFPSSKIHNTFYSLMEDIYNFQSRLKSDYTLYKSFKTSLIQSVQKMNNNKELMKSMSANFKDLPKHLQVIDLAEQYQPHEKTSENKQYSRIIDLFFKYDLNGYKTDGNFNNMFDDALHCYYGSQCDVFITNDDRCKYKAEKTYEKLNIKTKVIKSNQISEINCL